MREQPDGISLPFTSQVNNNLTQPSILMNMAQISTSLSKTIPGLLAPTSKAPWLLYANAWLPFPRRVIIYLREKQIPESQVKIAHVLDLYGTIEVKDESIPPRPAGSLPILAIRSNGEDADENGMIHARQSCAIMYFLEELCNANQYGFTSPRGSLMGETALERAKMEEIMGLAEECMVGWNAVRLFGTGAGSMELPQAAKECLRWERRALMTIERYLKDRDMSLLKNDQIGYVHLGDIVLYNFLEFVHECYGVDITIGSGEDVTDVYGRQVREEFQKLAEFYQAFKTRESARMLAERGDVAPELVKKNMSKWHDGVL